MTLKSRKLQLIERFHLSGQLIYSTFRDFFTVIAISSIILFCTEHFPKLINFLMVNEMPFKNQMKNASVWAWCNIKLWPGKFLCSFFSFCHLHFKQYFLRNSSFMIPCYSAALKKITHLRFKSVFWYSFPQVSIQCFHSFIECWKLGQSLKLWGTYFPTKLSRLTICNAFALL